MWLATLRDLQWRRRRFAIAILGTALVFAMTLVLAGLSASFRNEASRAVTRAGADRWVVRAGISGPFTGLSALDDATVDQIARAPGVVQVDPFIFVHQAVAKPHLVDVNLIGYRLGRLGAPAVARGRLPREAGDAVVDTSLHLGLGRVFAIGRRPFRVVGVGHGLTMNAGVADVFVSIADARSLAFGGRPIAMAALTRGIPTELPPGLAALTPQAVRADLLRPLGKGVQAIDFSQALLWVVAGTIVGSVVYLSALDRARDFAVFKATGSTTVQLGASLALESVMLSLTAALLAMLVARVLAPRFPIALTVPGRAVVLLPGVAVIVGIVASASGLRRAVKVDPALAFGGP